MAKNTSIGIDIGNNRLKVVQLRKTSNGIKIERYFVKEYNLSSKEPESSEARFKEIIQILGALFKDTKPVNVVFTISKYGENIRTLSLPFMTEKKLRDALKLGGHQDFIPFNLNNMIWDINVSNIYRRKEEINNDGKEKMDVTFVVAKREAVNKYLDIAEQLNFSLDFLESSTMASLNFSCFNEVIPQEKVWGKVDFGAETTSVNVLEGEGLKFGLNVPWGVNDIIEAVQSTLSMDRLAAKKFVANMDFDPSFISDNEQIQKVAIALEPKIKDFLRQLNGAFSFFESKNAGKPVSEVIISGGGAKLINIAKYISSKTTKNARIEDMLNENIISYDKKQKTELLAALPLLAVALGAALRNLVPVKNNINLLPFEVIIGRKLRSRRSLIIVSAACIFLVLLLGSVYKMKQRSEVVSKIDEINRQLSVMSEDVKELRMKKKSLDSLKGLDLRYTFHTKKFKIWSEQVYRLSTIVPEKMWLFYADWSSFGFRASGACKEDVVKQFSINGEDQPGFKGIKYSTREKEGQTTFDAWIKEEKKVPAVKTTKKPAVPERRSK
ncbi:MAG: pilus assembly protein PilM [Candidatus Firestonebacteria bacterium]|nr:pilus assembly protein PilM [Candidatus Firestonebacteria bacterium]